MKVFVYGTLRRGECNHRFLATARFLGEAVSVDRNFWLTGRSVVPHLSQGSEPSSRRQFQAAIKGELYDVDRAILARLDLLEGHPNYYERQRRRFRLGNSRAQTAWVYLKPHPANRRMPPHRPVGDVLEFPKEESVI